MNKPRIIIADTDINIVFPIQLEFIKEFFEKIDLELITDNECFINLFQTPQTVDILIVTERWYSENIRKHNIANVFVMSESLKEENSAEQFENVIYKYSSPKEILEQIKGLCRECLKGNIGNSNKTQVIMVYSAAGGAGKTAIATGMSSYLAKIYKNVLYINASWMHTFQTILDNPTTFYDIDIYAHLIAPSDNVLYDIKPILRNEGFTYIPPFKAALMSLGIDFDIYKKIILSAKKTNDYDYIIVDVNSEFNLEAISLMEISDRVVIVMKQDLQSANATNCLMANMNGASSDKYIYVCNDYDDEQHNAIASSKLSSKLKGIEYVEHINTTGVLKPSDIANEKGIGKLVIQLL